MWWIIYFSGLLVTFLLCKLLRGKLNNEWADVGVTIVLSILSWIGICFLLIIGIIIAIKEMIKDKNPPKWL